MNMIYLLAIVAWLVVLVSACARISDIPRSKWSPAWHVRRVGLLFTVWFAVIMLLSPGKSTWYTTLGAWGWAFTWLTTPGLPPWHKWISGLHRPGSPDAFWPWLKWEWKHLRESFRHPGQY